MVNVVVSRIDELRRLFDVEHGGEDVAERNDAEEFQVVAEKILWIEGAVDEFLRVVVSGDRPEGAREGRREEVRGDQPAALVAGHARRQRSGRVEQRQEHLTLVGGLIEAVLEVGVGDLGGDRLVATKQALHSGEFKFGALRPRIELRRQAVVGTRRYRRRRQSPSEGDRDGGRVGVAGVGADIRRELDDGPVERTFPPVLVGDMFVGGDHLGEIGRVVAVDGDKEQRRGEGDCIARLVVAAGLEH
jgi:hypothetical protein